MNSKLRDILGEYGNALIDKCEQAAFKPKTIKADDVYKFVEENMDEAEKAIIALISDRERLARIDTAEKLRYALHPHKGATGIIDNEIATLRNQLSRKEQTDE